MLTSHETLIFGFVISAGLLCTGARAQDAPEKTADQKSTGKHYVLPANKDTVQWGWYDPAEKPKLVVNSGDTVSIETWLHGMDEIKPGVTVDEIVKLRLANDGGGPHSITGPIYVNGAEPGDTMEIHITKIVMKDSGFNFNLPGKQFPTVGLLASEFPDGHVQYFKLNSETMTTEFKPGIVLLADYGFNSYSTLIETRREITDKKPDLVQRFVDASIIGWYNYLYGDNAPANALIKKLNPEMTDELLAYSVARMKEYGIVDSGDTLRDGIGAMNDTREASFFDKMVRAGVVRSDIDYRKGYTLRFVNKGVGLDLRPKNQSQ